MVVIEMGVGIGIVIHVDAGGQIEIHCWCMMLIQTKNVTGGNRIIVAKDMSVPTSIGIVIGGNFIIVARDMSVTDFHWKSGLIWIEGTMEDDVGA